jgi:predicted transcriptional regulator of viral defense system
VSVIDRRIAALAEAQHGVVAAGQLIEVGFSRTAIKRRVADGLLRRIHRGVYAFGLLTKPRGRWMAAVLALGPRALLSHREAAALHGLLSSGRSRTDVTVPGRARQRQGIDVHATQALHVDDRASIDGIPVTSVARTLLDLAELVPPHPAEARV